MFSLLNSETLDAFRFVMNCPSARDCNCDLAVQRNRGRLPAGHYELGQAFVQKHSYNEAIAEFHKAIELSGGSVPCSSNLAYADAVSNKRNEA